MNTTPHTSGRYRGRFAPSPTGPLHFGSLVAAVGSYLQARARGGTWLVRMEDLDPPREQLGAADDILRTLERFGFEWHGPVLYQSTRHEAYRETIEQLRRDALAYPCDCSRKEIREAQARAGANSAVYPGTCRSGARGSRRQYAIRLLTEDQVIAFDDALQGRIAQHLQQEVGDFVIRRADGLFAYQLAVVVDDAEQGITEVVRGSDLLDSTPRQIYLQQRLGLATPDYVHLPVAVNALGQKLSKQSHAPAANPDRPIPALWQALLFLGQRPSAKLLDAELTDIWQWAIDNWRLADVPRRLTLPAEHLATKRNSE